MPFNYSRIMPSVPGCIIELPKDKQRRIYDVSLIVCVHCDHAGALQKHPDLPSPSPPFTLS